MDVEEFRPVKQFRWLLEDSQKTLFAKWLRSAVPAHSSFAPALMHEKVDDVTSPQASAASSASSDKGQLVVASSSACSAPIDTNVATDKKKKKAKGPPEPDTNSKKAMLDKFFKKGV